MTLCVCRGTSVIVGAMKVVVCAHRSVALQQEQPCLLEHAPRGEASWDTGPNARPGLKEYLSQIVGEKHSIKTFPSQHHCADTEAARRWLIPG